MLGDYLREHLIALAELDGVCGDCGCDISVEAKSRFIDGWVRRYRKGLREGGAAGLAYRRERKITCPECGRRSDVQIAAEMMASVTDLIESVDPVFLRSRAENSVTKLPALQKKLSDASEKTDALMSRKPRLKMSRPSVSLIDSVAGFFSASYKTRRAEEIAAQMPEYESTVAAHKICLSEWMERHSEAEAEEKNRADELVALHDEILGMCKMHGILPLLFPEFVNRCTRETGCAIQIPSAQKSVRAAVSSAAKTRKRGAAGVSVGPGGVRPWVRVGGMGMSFGKTGIGLFARKGPFAIYAKNGKIRVGGRLFRF